MDNSLPHELAYEHMLISRHALQGAPYFKREKHLDRSATVLLARLEAQGPMSVAELAEAFGLDISTVHRQIAAAINNGLIERVSDSKSGQGRKHRATDLGKQCLEEEFKEREIAAARAIKDWTQNETAEFVRLLRKFNREVETLREQPWPREEP